MTFTGVSHTNVTPVGTLHQTGTVTCEIAFAPGDPTQPTYTGEFTAWNGQEGAVCSTITSTGAFHDTLRGSDGSSIRDRGVFHLSVLACG